MTRVSFDGNAPGLLVQEDGRRRRCQVSVPPRILDTVVGSRPKCSHHTLHIPGAWIGRHQPLNEPIADERGSVRVFKKVVEYGLNLSESTMFPQLWPLPLPNQYELTSERDEVRRVPKGEAANLDDGHLVRPKQCRIARQGGGQLKDGATCQGVRWVVDVLPDVDVLSFRAGRSGTLAVRGRWKGVRSRRTHRECVPHRRRGRRQLLEATVHAGQGLRQVTNARLLAPRKLNATVAVTTCLRRRRKCTSVPVKLENRARTSLENVKGGWVRVYDLDEATLVDLHGQGASLAPAHVHPGLAAVRT
mmetsp:Transcript_15923/g.49762  ORF Transcript_15923/g.49762 Transcript_15923/m.49762 type:complete len:304 (+) Transcript_15923:1966-2877(+)